MAYRRNPAGWRSENHKKAMAIEEIAALMKEAEEKIIQAERIAKEADIPFEGGVITSDTANRFQEDHLWYASTCSGQTDGDNWEHIEGTPVPEGYYISTDR